MRLGKRIISAVLAACITAVTPLASVTLPVAFATAEETKATAEDEVSKTPDTEEKYGIKINSLTTSGTYYGVDGKFPIYVEYDASGVVNTYLEEGEEVPPAHRKNLKLFVTKKDGTEFSAEEDNGFFTIKDCTGFESGKSYKLDFSIKYVPSGETLFSVEREVLFEEQKAWASCNYLPTGEGAYNLDLYVYNDTLPDNDKDDDDDDGYSVNNISLMDKNGNIAATGIYSEYFNGDNVSDSRYSSIFRKSCHIPDGMNIYNADYCKVYCTRELEAGEELEAVYYIDEKMYRTGIKFTVTDKPYIKNAGEAGIPDGDIYSIEVSAYNIDFNKLSLNIKDRETGEILGSNINFVQNYNNHATYYVKCNNGAFSSGFYDIGYNYSESGTDVISENAAGYYCNDINYYESSHCIWNYKTGCIECYDAKIPSGSAISYKISSSGYVYTSGEGIIADSSHIAVIPLKKELESGIIRENTETSYYLYITYTDINGKVNTSVSIFNFRFANYSHLSVYDPEVTPHVRDCYYNMDTSLYLPDSKELAFSIKFKCYNPDKLKNTCTAIISDKRRYEEDENKIGAVELSLKNENGSLSYNGTYKGSLNNKNRYYLLFNPYQDNIYFIYDIDISDDRLDNIPCSFSIADNNRLCLEKQYNYLDAGEVVMCFPSEEIADFYCGEKDSKLKDKLKIKILGFQGNEIGTYKFTNNDFTITGKKAYRIIQFSGSVKQMLANINYCKVYLYYGDGEEKDTIIADSEHPEESFYSTEYNSENIHRPEYIRNSQSNGWLSLGTSSSILIDGYYMDTGFTTVYGSKSAFPATVTITGWNNNLNTIKTITVPEPGYNFTEADMEGLSPEKKYNFFLKGADGSVKSYMNNYIIKSGETENNKPDDDNNNGNNNSGNGSNNGTGIIVPYPQTPAVTPEVSAAPAASATPGTSGKPVETAVPETSVTPVETAAPEVSVTPVETAAPGITSIPVETTVPEVSSTPGAAASKEPENVNNIENGTKTTDKKSKAVYKVTGTDQNKTVEYIKSTKQNLSNITIPDTIKINGTVYKVTSVGKNAFKNNKKLKSIQIGKNIVSIGKKAFYGCKELSNITIRTNKLTAANIGKNAFSKGFSKPQIKADKSKWKLYKKIFKAKGMSKKCKFIKL